MAQQDTVDVNNLAHIKDAIEANNLKSTKGGDIPSVTVNNCNGNSPHSSDGNNSNEKGVDTNSTPAQGSDKDGEVVRTLTECGKYLLHETECTPDLAVNFSQRKKWTTLIIVGLVQVSMNFNTSLYSNAITGIAEQFNVTDQIARLGAAIFLVTYAFGCELWAPWSEELGRYWVMQASLMLVNFFQIPVGLAGSIQVILVARLLGGLSTAGGSITLGMVADMWEKEDHQVPVAFVVFTSVGGSVLGPIVGGFIDSTGLNWKWNIWVQLIVGGVVQLLHFFLVPETRTTILMDRIAKKRRAEAKRNGVTLNLWGPNEITPFKERFSFQEIGITWMRPFKMFVTEPIVLYLSLLSGFSDALIFMFIQSFGLVYSQWSFGPSGIGLAFLPFLVGYLIAWASFIPAISRNKRERADNPQSERAQFESRLKWLLYTVLCLPIGLIGFAWTSGGPPVHWIGSMVFAAVCGIANYSIYMATIDYMVTAYGPYSASATGGNGWARDFLAGLLTCAAPPFYTKIPSKYHLQIASTILFAISIPLVWAVFYIYKKGPELRQRSPFAQQLLQAREEGRAGAPFIPAGGYGTAPGTATHSKTDLGLLPYENMEPTRSQSMRDLRDLYIHDLRGRVGFSRTVSRTNSPTRNHKSRPVSPSRKGIKRPAPASRATSMYVGKGERDKIDVDPDLLVPPTRSPSKFSSPPESDPDPTPAWPSPNLDPMKRLPATPFRDLMPDHHNRIAELRTSATFHRENVRSASVVTLGRGSRNSSSIRLVSESRRASWNASVAEPVGAFAEETPAAEHVVAAGKTVTAQGSTAAEETAGANAPAAEVTTARPHPAQAPSPSPSVMNRSRFENMAQP